MPSPTRDFTTADWQPDIACRRVTIVEAAEARWLLWGAFFTLGAGQVRAGEVGFRGFSIFFAHLHSILAPGNIWEAPVVSGHNATMRPINPHV